MLYRHRTEAGCRLALSLQAYGGPDTLVIGLPRGGVMVAREVARALGARLEVMVACKIGAPGNPEYAIGAMAEIGQPQLNEEVIQELAVPEAYIAEQINLVAREIERRVKLYRGGRPLPDLRGKTVILVDDGIATGFTMLTAIQAVKAQGPKLLVVAVPVAPVETAAEIASQVDRLVCPATPIPFFAVGAFYEDFGQVSDEEVREALGQRG